jgi:hypothetical protein
MQKFEVEVQVMPSCGGGFRRVQVKAKDKTDAIVKATVALDEAGIDRWSLVQVVSALN